MVTIYHHYYGCYVSSTVLSTLHVLFTLCEVVSSILFILRTREVSSERSSHLSRVTQQACGTAGMLTHAKGVPSPQAIWLPMAEGAVREF